MQPWCGTGDDVKLKSCHLYAPGPLIALLSSPCMGHLSICLHHKHSMARVIKRWLSSSCAGRKTSNFQWLLRLGRCQTEEEEVFCPVPSSLSPHLCGAPRLGSWITMGQAPLGWPSSIQVEDVETPAVKQKTHWNRDLQPSTCVWPLK